ncbi:uncharacterized protein LOC129138329 isoform X2 [Pan troglodytes]|uniref:uncharacterized protein LOC129138329 isoform X2 n=1 Tax=Pan troglodytes TaxID=9598 RepID=UPI0030134184
MQLLRFPTTKNQLEKQTPYGGDQYLQTHTRVKPCLQPANLPLQIFWTCQTLKSYPFGVLSDALCEKNKQTNEHLFVLELH